MTTRATLLEEAAKAKQAFDAAEEGRRVAYNVWREAKDAWAQASVALDTFNEAELRRAVEGVK